MERKIEDAKKTPLADIEEVEKILSVKPDDAKALNLRAQIEASKGDWKSAEATLDRAIMSNPNSYYAYYNMAMLIIKFRPSSRDAARRYYETGRQLGGPVNKYLERAFK
jgi:Tfp pilus assembly protein PilF